MQGVQPGSVIAPGSKGPETTWQFHADEQPQAPAPPPVPKQAAGESVAWTASEFIAHNKSSGWYMLLGLGALGLAAVVYLLTRDKISTAMVVIVAVIFGIFAARKPRELDYSVDSSGMHIGNKFYPYGSFRSFAIVQEEAVESIWLMPLKRFMPIISIYFEPTDGKKIAEVLSKFLPVENRQPDPVDKLMHRLRF